MLVWSVQRLHCQPGQSTVSSSKQAVQLQDQAGKWHVIVVHNSTHTSWFMIRRTAQHIHTCHQAAWHQLPFVTAVPGSQHMSAMLGSQIESAMQHSIVTHSTLLLPAISPASGAEWLILQAQPCSVACMQPPRCSSLAASALQLGHILAATRPTSCDINTALELGPVPFSD